LRFWAVAEQEAKSHAVSMLLNRATGPVGLMREGQNIYFGGGVRCGILLIIYRIRGCGMSTERYGNL